MPSEYWAGRTVAVAGGLGFIGSHFVEEFLSAGAEVLCVYRTERPDVIRQLPAGDRLHLCPVDLHDPDGLRALLKQSPSPVDTIVNCAGLEGNAAFKVQRAAEIVDSTLRIASNILNCALELDIENVVMISTAQVRMVAPADCLAADENSTEPKQFSRNGYLLSKLYAETAATLFGEQFGLKVFLPRPAGVYGPRDDFSGGANRVIPSMLTKIAAGEEIPVWGDGSQTRSFVFVRDLTRVVLSMVETDKYRTLSIGSDEAVSILELSRLLSTAMGRAARVRLEPDMPTGPSGELDVSRMNEIIDFTPVSLEAGLRETIAWFQQNHHAGA